MRSDYPHTRTESTVAKASTKRRGIGSKEKVEAHAAAFGTLLDDVAKHTGLPGDEVIYHDPMGFATNGEPIDLRAKMFDQVWSDAFDAFNGQIRKGAHIRDAAEDVCKALDRSNYSLPIFVSPNVTITDQRQTPFADMVTRVAIQEDEYNVDEQTDHGDAERFYEPGTNSGSNETWAENDDSYASHSYGILPYGRQTSVTDFLQLAAQTLRSSIAVTEEALMRSQRFYEENQAMRGNGDATGFSGNDTNGFAGLPDLVASEADQFNDRSGDGDAAISWVRSAIEDVRVEGSQYDDIVNFTDHTTFGELKGSVDDVLRYESPGDSLNFGFQALNIDGTPVVETHGIQRSDGDRQVITTDMSEVVMPMLQDATMHPLARTTPEEDVAIDSYGAVAVSSTSRIVVNHSIGGA